MSHTARCPYNWHWMPSVIVLHTSHASSLNLFILPALYYYAASWYLVFLRLYKWMLIKLKEHKKYIRVSAFHTLKNLKFTALLNKHIKRDVFVGDVSAFLKYSIATLQTHETMTNVHWPGKALVSPCESGFLFYFQNNFTFRISWMRSFDYVQNAFSQSQVCRYGQNWFSERSLASKNFVFCTPAPFEPPFNCDSVANAAINYHDSPLFVPTLLIGVINGDHDAPPKAFRQYWLLFQLL